MIAKTFLKTTSPAFQAAFSALEKIVQQFFPKATTGSMYNVPGFKVRLNTQPITQWKGTIDPNHLYLGLAEGRSGFTLYVGNPQDYYWLDTKKSELTKAGFKVMRSCLVWNKKLPLPLGVLKKLVGELAAALSTP